MKKIIIGIIIGMLISSGAYAAVSISSDKISYNNTTVKDSLDNLFDESLAGKNLIVKSLSDNGLNLNNESSYSEIVNVINESYTNINNGKLLLAEAITNKGVETSETDDFSTMATKIDNIITKSDRDFTCQIRLALHLQSSGYNNQVYIYVTVTRKNGVMSFSQSPAGATYVSSTDVANLYYDGASIRSFSWND